MQAAESSNVQQQTNHSDSVNSLAHLWARKYIQNLQSNADEAAPDNTDLLEVTAKSGRAHTVEKLNQALRFTSAQAWSKTETLLAQEVQRHSINTDLIDPWQVAQDSRLLFEKTLAVYIEQSPLDQIAAQTNNGSLALPAPGRLSVVISQEVGKVRQKYTIGDPRVLGFVSMQFHYSGQMLLDLLSPLEKALVGSYFKVIDDHLYMPLQRSYEAAAAHDYNSPALIAVRQLLPLSSAIATSICQQVADMYPSYSCYNGILSAPAIKVSTIRDVEMFQVYLCLCVLEGNIDALKQELFPLCVMLYPPLKVSWALIRNMLRLLGKELGDRLPPEQMDAFRPYVRALWEMFSEEILPDK
jgi:hypothetical protein